MTAPATKVDIATAADLPEIMRLLHLMWEEGGMFPLDEDCAKETFDRAFNKQGGIIGVIRGEKSALEAMIYLLIGRFWYTKANHIEELFNFVAPDFRKSHHARDLILFAQQCQKKIGIPLTMGILTNKRMEAKVRYYRRILGVPAGVFFVCGASWITDSIATNIWREKGDEQLVVPKSARVIPNEVLTAMGHGNPSKGRSLIDRFINRKINGQESGGTLPLIAEGK